jgi:pimeloyl-ACP methyl ester carboxylesterase
MRQNKILFLTFLFFLCSTTSILCKVAYIIVHGTWAAKRHWYQPGGDFFETLQKRIGTSDSLHSFVWSGAYQETERVKAGAELAALITKLCRQRFRIVLIAHSHGGTVAFRAVEQLKEGCIDVLFLLGTPLRKQYIPPRERLRFIYNFFSFNDFLQTLFGLYARELPEDDRTANFLLIIDGIQPSHIRLHNPALAQQIPHLVSIALKERFVFPKCHKNLHISMHENGYEIICDTRRERLEHRAIISQQHLLDLVFPQAAPQTV